MFIFLYINIFIIAKILIQDKRPRLKESLYFIFTGFFVEIVIISLAILFNWQQLFGSPIVQDSDLHLHPILFHIADALTSLFLFLYIYKWRKYTVKKAVIITLSVMLVAAIIDHSYAAISVPFFSVNTYHHFFIVLLVLYVVSSIFAILIVRFSKNLRKAINQSSSMQTALLCIVIFLLVSFQVAAAFGHHLAYPGYTANIILVNAIFFVAFTSIAFVSFVMFAKSLEAKYETQAKEAEQQSLERYTTELERNQTAIRKFKHDYQNILLSISTFLDEGDLDGLKQYYEDNIVTASQIIATNDIALEGLSKIRMREIKSILAAKLMMAQNLGIAATFEADEEIDHIPMDSVTLVRMLGIILDNAIEELVTIGEGRLFVGCFRSGKSVIFIVQNTCRADMPDLHQLLQAGFSTKGEGRGLGLGNLLELADAQPNIALETGIENGNFIQKLMIGPRD